MKKKKSPMVISINKFMLLFKEASEVLKEMAKEKNIQYKSILCIGDGGLIPGRMMKTVLNIPLCIIQISRYHKAKTFSEIIGPLKFPCLIVDEIIDAGVTVEQVYKDLQKRPGAEKGIGLFSIIEKPACRERLKKLKLIQKVTFRIKTDNWVTFWWE